MPYNLDIPGWMPEAELKVLERLAATIPPDGSMVEVGSYCGRSSWCWAKSVAPGVDVVCIDIWDPHEHPYSPPSRTEANAVAGEDFGVTGGRPRGEWGLRENFDFYTRDCPNISALTGHSPYDFNDFPNDCFDLVFLDGVHHNPVFRDDVHHWYPRVMPGGILCGDDCAPTHPDVEATVAQFCAERGLQYAVEGRIWMLRKPAEDQGA